jgi:hypothetical protein
MVPISKQQEGESLFMSLRSSAIGFLAAAAVLGSEGAASAQILATARVVKERATVRRLSARGSEALTVVPRGTELEVLDKEAQSYWVLLERDAHGTRFAGWVNATDVEVLAADKSFQPIIPPDPAVKRSILGRRRKPATEPELAETADAAKPGKAEKPPHMKAEKGAPVKAENTQQVRAQKADDKRLKKAQEAVEKARRDLEKKSRGAAAPLPAPPPVASSETRSPVLAEPVMPLAIPITALPITDSPASITGNDAPQ